MSEKQTAAGQVFAIAYTEFRSIFFLMQIRDLI